MNIKDISLERKSGGPLYIQIKDQIKQMIAKDLLPEGERLLSSRKLAELLGVNRSTVVSAYNELADEGIIDIKVCSRPVIKMKNHTFEKIENGHAMNWPQFFALTFKTNYHPVHDSLLNLFSAEDAISLGIASPDPMYYPADDFRRLINRLLKERARYVLQMSPVKGLLPLRELLAEWMTHEGNFTSSQDVMITSGASQALYLVLHTIVNVGDLVVVEGPTAPNFLWVLQGLRARVLDIPVDEDGMMVDHLEDLASRQNVKMIYTIPTFQNPTGSVLSLARRKKLLDIAQRFQIPIIEDDPYSRIYFNKVPPPSLKALDKHDNVIYVGSLSKILFPGLRLGWLVAPHQVMEQLTPHKQVIDIHTNSLEQYAVVEYISQGLLDKHMKAMRGVYARKRDLMISALRKYCSNRMEWNVPGGGYSLWCRLNGRLSSHDLLTEAMFKKVSFLEGENFYPKEGPPEWLRLVYSYVDESLIEEGIKRLAWALRKLGAKSGMSGTRRVDNTTSAWTGVGRSSRRRGTSVI